MRLFDQTKLDEMQEQKLLHIEHRAFWLTYGALLLVIFLELLFGGNDIRLVAGELAVFLLACLYILIYCLKEGIWSRHVQPSVKNNVLFSLLSGLGGGLVVAIINYYNYGYLPAALLSFALCFVLCSIACLAMLFFTASIYKKRHAQLEDSDNAEITEL